jgi:lysophospholipase L1-like esterase
MAGTNDLRQGATDQVILDNLRQIVRRLRLNHPQSQVIVQSILPTRLSVIPSERIRNLNQQIAVIAKQEGIGYLNLHTLFADGQGQLRQDLTTMAYI